MSKATSLISILSTDHGKLRREQRDISKRDLQKALKHGTSKRTGKRWKIEYDGVIFITDNARKREITAFPSPLAKAPLDDHARQQHEKAKQILKEKPDLCKSHTVFVVDNSGSMQTHDIPLHRDRQVAAYSTLALEYVAEQLFKGTANNSDVVSLVEFNVTARVAFSREPCSWVLYNKMLARREPSNFRYRQSVKDREDQRADSNYIPALKAANKLLDIDRHEECALAMLFLSDGEPTDSRQYKMKPLRAQKEICSLISKISKKYESSLSLSFVGFGNASGDFSTLQAMTDACNAGTESKRAEFFYCDKFANTIGTALSSLTTSLTQTRTSLVGRGASFHGPKRIIASETNDGIRRAWHFHIILRHWIYSPTSGRLVNLYMVPPGAQESDGAALVKVPKYLAMNTKSCGEGAERIAFRCSLASLNSERDFTLGRMVAKETNLVSRLEEKANFHKVFCETQSVASFLADEFNSRIRAIQTDNATTTPAITFLPCSILELEDGTSEDGTKDVLVEKMLDTTRYHWSKWNDNGGGVGGQSFHAPLDIEYELNALALNQQTIVEEESDEDSDEGSDDDEAKEENVIQEPTRKGIYDGIHPSLYLQAFSHFSYVYTDCKLLVCDLQGIYNTDTVPPTFELTDPAIHYDSKQGRRLVYGRTDKGRKGIQLFLTTHKCSYICELVNLSKPNLAWRKAWRDQYHKKFSKYENPANKQDA